MGWFQDRKISTKLLIAGVCTLIFIAGTGFAGFWATKSIQANLDDIFKIRLWSLDYLVEADRDLQQLLVAERSMIFANPKSDIFKELVEEYENNLKQSDERWNKYKKLMATDEEKKIARAYEKSRLVWKENSRKVVDGRIADTREGRRLAIDLSLGLAKTKFEEMRKNLDKLQQITLKLAGDAHHQAEKSYEQMIKVLLAITGLAIIVTILMAFLNHRSIAGPIARVVEVANKLELGDLNVRLKTGKDETGKMGQAINMVVEQLSAKSTIAAGIAKGDLNQDVVVSSEADSLGQALYTMVNSLNEIVHELNTAAEEVSTGSGQVADSSQALSQGATEQAASLEEITSSMTEIGNQTKTNAENASQANKMAASAREVAQNGNAQMQEMMTAMGDINESSKEIAKIIKTIDDIAFQTNLLALNAAVEAARAGKHGKGFAVVAQEVRNLAARSGKAAQETTDLIDGSIKKVENGTQMADQTATALSEIVDNVTKVADLVGEIAYASNEQAQGINQINEGLGQIDRVTQQNTASAEETASAAEELMAQASNVRGLLTHFSIKGNDGNGGLSGARDISRHALSDRPKELTQGGNDNWGSTGQGNGNSAAKSVLKPEEIIALDDKDFGRY